MRLTSIGSKTQKLPKKWAKKKKKERGQKPMFVVRDTVTFMFDGQEKILYLENSVYRLIKAAKREKGGLRLKVKINAKRVL